MARAAMLMLLALGIAAAASAATDVLDSEIAELEARLASARARRAAGDEATVSRKRMAETDIFALANTVADLMTKVDSIQKQQAKLPETLASLSAAVGAIVPSINRIDGLVKTVDGIAPKVTALEGEVAAIDDKVDKKFVPLKKDIDGKVDALKKTLGTTKTALEKQMKDAEDSIPKSIATQKAASKKVTDALDKSVAAAVAAAASAGADSLYTQWGSKACTAPSGKASKKLYEGWWYGVRHNEAGGGGADLCLRDTSGANGGNPTGGDSADMIFPVRLEHTSYTGSVYKRGDSYNIPCARCFLKGKNCYLETVNDKCTVPDYEPYYTGFMFGGHQGHHGNNNRLCVDQNRPASEWDRNGYWAGHVYPTIRRESVESIGAQSAVRCHLCCQK